MSERQLNQIVESEFGGYQEWRYFVFDCDELLAPSAASSNYLRVLGKESRALHDH